MNYAMIPDMLFVLLSLYHPIFIIVALIQYSARRHPYTARGFWLLAGCPEVNEVVMALLPGLVMSSEEENEVNTSIQPGIEQVVLPQQDAENTSGTTFSRDDLIDLLLRQEANGKPLFTANKIADLLKGTPWSASRNTIMDEIARRRSPEKPPQGQRRLERPEEGW